MGSAVLPLHPFELQGEHIYRLEKDSVTGEIQSQLLVPQLHPCEVMQIAHAIPQCFTLDRRKLSQILDHFFWHGVHQEVKLLQLLP